MRTNVISKIGSFFEWAGIGLFSKAFSTDLTTGARIFKIANVRKIASNDAGWIVPIDLLHQKSICYCAGVGEDLDFDIELIRAYGCEVFAFDPTPQAKAHVYKNIRDLKGFHFQDFGLWYQDNFVRFYHHANSDSPSYSIVNLHKTDTFVEAYCKRLSTIIKENRHHKIDLLKLDIEGAEYRVLDSIIQDCLDISIILVDFCEICSKRNHGYRRRVTKSIHQLCDYGYTLVALNPKSKYTFVKKDILISYLRSMRYPILPIAAETCLTLL